VEGVQCALEHALSVASSRVQVAVVECGSTGALGETAHVRNRPEACTLQWACAHYRELQLH
jgi:hypothetical protein